MTECMALRPHALIRITSWRQLRHGCRIVASCHHGIWRQHRTQLLNDSRCGDTPPRNLLGVQMRICPPALSKASSALRAIHNISTTSGAQWSWLLARQAACAIGATSSTTATSLSSFPTGEQRAGASHAQSAYGAGIYVAAQPESIFRIAGQRTIATNLIHVLSSQKNILTSASTPDATAFTRVNRPSVVV